ncbi:unknown [Faecalibacterium sp. CAG:82]|nr:unknown [Faecalibacterium sp. CAG:82]
MSMPRAAISVATSTFVLPALKPSSAATRADWLLLPWMAAAGIPCLLRSLAILSAPCLVRLNTSALTTGGFRFLMSQGSRNFLLPFSTKYRLWSMRSTVLETGSTLTNTGSCRMPAASCSISLGMVALNMRFWRCLGSLAITFFTSWTKPMSSIRSASSSTKISMFERSTSPCPTRSFNRPGQAMRISTPFLMASTCGAWPTPPKMTVARSFWYLP